MVLERGIGVLSASACTTACRFEANAAIAVPPRLAPPQKPPPIMANGPLMVPSFPNDCANSGESHLAESNLSRRGTPASHAQPLQACHINRMFKVDRLLQNIQILRICHIHGPLLRFLPHPLRSFTQYTECNWRSLHEHQQAVSLALKMTQLMTRRPAHGLTFQQIWHKFQMERLAGNLKRH